MELKSPGSLYRVLNTGQHFSTQRPIHSLQQPWGVCVGWQQYYSCVLDTEAEGQRHKVPHPRPPRRITGRAKI